MTTSQDTSYPAELRRADERRGRADGEQRVPALSEVRRRQQELQATGSPLTVGYQVVLLAEFENDMERLRVQFQHTERTAAQEIRQHLDNIVKAEDDVLHHEQQFAAASAPLTVEELLPRNFEEETWAPTTVRNRREVARARRIRLAAEALDRARGTLRQRQADRTAAEQRRDDALAGFEARVNRRADLCRRRMVAYADALAQRHPDGRTLHAMLSTPEIPLPSWLPVHGVVDQPTEEAQA